MTAEELRAKLTGRAGALLTRPSLFGDADRRLIAALYAYLPDMPEAELQKVLALLEGPAGGGETQEGEP